MPLIYQCVQTVDTFFNICVSEKYTDAQSLDTFFISRNPD
jgi:hypothetical protein